MKTPKTLSNKLINNAECTQVKINFCLLSFTIEGSRVTSVKQNKLRKKEKTKEFHRHTVAFFNKCLTFVTGLILNVLLKLFHLQ